MLSTAPSTSHKATDDDFYDGGSRVGIIPSILGAYRSVAMAQLRREIPELHYELVAAKQRQALKMVQGRSQ